MGYRITAEPDILRAELFDRETVEETQAFLRAVVREGGKYGRSGILILVRSSKSIFQVVPHRLIEYFEELSASSPRRIALVGDTRDLRMSHDYIELLARQRGLDVRSFPDETAAFLWLKHQRQRQDRRQQGRMERRELQERRQGQERRAQNERRSQERRASSESPSPA